MKTTILFALILIAGLQYKLWFAGEGVPEVWRLKKQVKVLVSKNKILRTRNLELDAEVQDLKTGQHAIEERARAELGMIKDDEIFYQLISPPQEQRISPSP